MTAPSHDEQPLRAAAHPFDKLEPAEADRLIAELEALLEEVRHLRARYRPRQREPDTDR